MKLTCRSWDEIIALYFFRIHGTLECCEDISIGCNSVRRLVVFLYMQGHIHIVD